MSTASGNSEAVRVFESRGTDTLLAAANVNALKGILVKREKQMPETPTVAR